MKETGIKISDKGKESILFRMELIMMGCGITTKRMVKAFLIGAMEPPMMVCG